MENIVKIINKLDTTYTGNGVGEKAIQMSEEMLGLKFSDEYREYLLNFGVACVSGHELTGICSFPVLDVVDVTLEERKVNSDVPHDLYVVEQNDDDAIIMWQNQKGEIYISENYEKPEKIYNSLGEYITKVKIMMIQE